jgi:DNA-binding NarL/FixJ family response regulator
LLAEDLGLEPGPELQAAEAEVLACPQRPGRGAPPAPAVDDAAARATSCGCGSVPGPPAGPLRVVVAEDDLLVREGLVRLLDTEDGIDVVATAETLPELLDTVADHRPDVVVTDICMPPGHSDEGLQAADRLRIDQPTVAVLVLSQHADPAYAHALLAGGARGRGYLLKDRLGHRRKLTEAIHAVSRGDTPIDPDVVDLLVTYRAAAPNAAPTAP